MTDILQKREVGKIKNRLLIVMIFILSYITFVFRGSNAEKIRMFTAYCIISLISLVDDDITFYLSLLTITVTILYTQPNRTGKSWLDKFLEGSQNQKGTFKGGGGSASGNVGTTRNW